MLLINRDLSQHALIVTVSDMTTISNPFYLLLIHSPFTHKTYRIQLPANSSAYKQRYDEFILPDAVFNDIEDGMYHYGIYQSATESSDETALGDPVELGLVKVTSSITDQTVRNTDEAETDDDFITYNPE